MNCFTTCTRSAAAGEHKRIFVDVQSKPTYRMLTRPRPINQLAASSEHEHAPLLVRHTRPCSRSYATRCTMSHHLGAAARREPEGLLTGVLGVQELGHAEGVCARQKGGTSVLHQSLRQCLRIRECNTSAWTTCADCYRSPDPRRYIFLHSGLGDMRQIVGQLTGDDRVGAATDPLLHGTDLNVREHRHLGVGCNSRAGIKR